jgi:hypothetical protein
MRIRHLLPAVGILAVLLGCVPVAEKGVTLASDFTALKIRRVAVAPVIFADEPLDWYFGENVATQLRRETVNTLESKGYEATLAGATLFRSPPPGSSLSSLAPPAPDTADAVLVIRLDHFLDAGRYNGGSDFGRDGGHTFFEIYATAALIERGGRLLWEDSGVGKGSSSGSSYLLDEFIVPADLVRSLFDTLPHAR